MSLLNELSVYKTQLDVATKDIFTKMEKVILDNQQTAKDLNPQLYDYSQIKTYDFPNWENDKYNQLYINDECIKYEPYAISAGYLSIIKFHPDEKVVIVRNYFYKDNSSTSITATKMYITNYGTIVELFISGDIASKSPIKIYYFNFWIPTDYIKILDSVLINIVDNYNPYCYKADAIKNVPSIIDAIKSIKDQLYNRVYFPKHLQDALEENAAIKAQQKEFLEKMTPGINYEKAMAEIENEKQRLKLISIKLKLKEEELAKKEKILSEIDVDLS